MLFISRQNEVRLIAQQYFLFLSLSLTNSRNKNLVERGSNQANVKKKNNFELFQNGQ